jgi:two-component system response regulator
MKTPTGPIEILLVEDSLPDVRLTIEALKETTVPHTLHTVYDGEQAMDFLRRRGTFVDAPRPDLVLLDLNLPRKSGKEVLQEIKDDGSLKHIPVVILSTSQADRDVVESYRLRANAYVTKPVELHDFMSVVKSIEQFWLEVVRLSRP